MSEGGDIDSKSLPWEKSPKRTKTVRQLSAEQTEQAPTLCTHQWAITSVALTVDGEELIEARVAQKKMEEKWKE